MRPDVTSGAALSHQKGRLVSSWPGHKRERFQGREGASGQGLSGDVQLSREWLGVVSDVWLSLLPAALCWEAGLGGGLNAVCELPTPFLPPPLSHLPSFQ